MKISDKIKRLLSVIAIITLFVCAESCKTSQTSDNNLYSISPVTVVSSKPDTLNQSQMDSLSKADRLPKYTDWRKSSFKDAETSEIITYYTIVDQESNTIYTLKPLKNNTFVLFKKMFKESY